MNMLTLLKLGGSLITDKTQTNTVRPATLARLADEIRAARQATPNLQLLLGHGSGSFGHHAAEQHDTRHGVASPEGWRGFVEVARAAQALHRLVLDALWNAGLPAIGFAPSAMVSAHNGSVGAWNLAPIQAALAAGLLPVLYGDVVFDSARGGIILSTEDLFSHLIAPLGAKRVLLAGIEPGVWADFPHCKRLLPEITPSTLGQAQIHGSAATDVTGGMATKVQQALQWSAPPMGAEVIIFSGESHGAVLAALTGETIGTRVHR